MKVEESNDLVVLFDADVDDDMVRVHKQPVNIRIRDVTKWARPLPPPSKRNSEPYWYFCAHKASLRFSIFFSTKRSDIKKYSKIILQKIHLCLGGKLNES